MPRDWSVPLRFGRVVEFDMDEPYTLRRVLQQFKKEYVDDLGATDLDDAFPKSVRGLHCYYEQENDYDTTFLDAFTPIYYEKHFRDWREYEASYDPTFPPLSGFTPPLWLKFVLHPAGAANTHSTIATDLWPNPFVGITTHTMYENYQVCRQPPKKHHHGLRGQRDEYPAHEKRRYAIPDKGPNGELLRGEKMPAIPMPSDSEDNYDDYASDGSEYQHFSKAEQLVPPQPR